MNKIFHLSPYLTSKHVWGVQAGGLNVMFYRYEIDYRQTSFYEVFAVARVRKSVVVMYFFCIWSQFALLFKEKCNHRMH